MWATRVVRAAAASGAGGWPKQAAPEGASLYTRFCCWYANAVGGELAKVGLREDDLLDPSQDLDVGVAMNRAPAEELALRNQRISRAIDLTLKHENLSPELQERQTPFVSYLAPHVDRVVAEKRERARLGSGAPYQRQLP